MRLVGSASVRIRRRDAIMTVSLCRTITPGPATTPTTNPHDKTPYYKTPSYKTPTHYITSLVVGFVIMGFCSREVVVGVFCPGVYLDLHPSKILGKGRPNPLWHSIPENKLSDIILATSNR